MGKFNRSGVRPAVTSAVKTDAAPTARTHEGAPGYARDAKSELFLLAVANMVGENTFYEKARRPRRPVPPARPSVRSRRRGVDG
ncbi:hypothetical protein [Actinomadura madurae]|uniref:hypothetical protein n=1 Tax=Actinomadura madurae TaxID=1993 RepID=UPI0027E23F95|nr:hypothetical protein [Actinomadura madurae]